MPKPFVVLWDHHLKVVLQHVFPRNKSQKLFKSIVLTTRKKESTKRNSSPNNGIASRAFAKLPSLHHYNKEYPTAHDMTKNLGIHHFFDGIYGSSPETPHKADVIRYAFANASTPCRPSPHHWGYQV